jgi:geranylgeranyl reductase family protein
MHEAGAHRHTDGGGPADRSDNSGPEIWDVAVVGGGPAGLAAARVAAGAGARTVVLERAEHPRYKTCGGGLIGASLAALAGHVKVPAREHIDSVTFTYHGRWGLTRRVTGAPALAMVCRDEFDTALRSAAVDAGAVIRERVTVRGLSADGEHPAVRLADGSTVTARIVIGADGSSGVCAPYVGVTYDQVDLGLELELPVEGPIARRWRGRVLLDWGHIPGSYAWVFPKGDKLTVGVIASRGTGPATRAYLAGFRHRIGLDGVAAERDSGHLTRCRSVDSPLRRGKVLVAGDAAGLLEPWTREGISFALRSGALAGAAAGAGDPDAYVAAVQRDLVPEMAAGRRLLAGFTHRPAAYHAAVATPPGWFAFKALCRGDMTWAGLAGHPAARTILAAIGRQRTIGAYSASSQQPVIGGQP